MTPDTRMSTTRRRKAIRRKPRTVRACSPSIEDPAVAIRRRDRASNPADVWIFLPAEGPVQTRILSPGMHGVKEGGYEFPFPPYFGAKRAKVQDPWVLPRERFAQAAAILAKEHYQLDVFVEFDPSIPCGDDCPSWGPVGCTSDCQGRIPLDGLTRYDQRILPDGRVEVHCIL